MSTLFASKKRKSTTNNQKVDSTPDVTNIQNQEDNYNHPHLPLQGNQDTIRDENKSISEIQNTVINTFSDIDLVPPLQQTCRSLGYKAPTPVQRHVIPFLLSNTSSHILALASTGSGKTAAFVLPILHHLSFDPYGIYAVILTPTRELAKQIYEQVLALGSTLNVKASLTIGGMDMTFQSCALSQKPHFCIATPGRLAALLRGPNPPILKNIRYVVMDEADRLLNPKSGFECDVAEILLHCTTTTISSSPIIKSTSSENEDKNDGVTDSLDHDSANDEVVVRKRRVNCQTLLFSATLTRSLESLESMAGAGLGRLPLKTFIIKSDDEDDSDGNDDENSVSSNDDDLGIDDDNESNKEITKINKSTSIPKIPPGLRQEYIFMPSHVRDAYLITAVRYLMMNGGRKGGDDTQRHDSSGWNDITHDQNATIHNDDTNGMDENRFKKAKSAIIFVSTCERTALISGILTELGVSNVALHSLLTQNRRLASLAKFKSQHVRVLVATDVASRGLDIPTVDLVLNAELPRRAVDYIHRVGRTARAGRRGRAVSLVGERDVALVHACEKMSGRVLEKCVDVNDDLAVKMLGSVTKATRLTKMKLADIGFDELVKKMKERKVREKKERQKAERAAAKVLKKARLTK